MYREELVKSLKLKGVGIEIGVQNGNFSKTILDNSDIYLYLVDAWRYFPEGYVDKCNVDPSRHIKRMVNTTKKLLPHEGRFTLIRDISINASKLFDDDFFDFIYIDANHSYESVLEDLKLWYPKVKTGGIISGHDYTTDLPSIDVKRAVDEFFSNLNKQVIVTTEKKYPSFYVYK